MAFYEWSKSLSVNIPSIDRQHQMLISYINELHDAIGASANASQLTGSVLLKLVNYTTVHFLYEEMLFGTYGYAEEEEHKQSHQKFIDQIAHMSAELKKGNPEIPEQLLELLKSWLNHHILKDDMAYSAFLVSKGVS